MFIVYLISGIAETNRAPFDVVEGESEIVAGHMIEYSGMAFALFFLGEYANMILFRRSHPFSFWAAGCLLWVSCLMVSFGWWSRLLSSCSCSSGSGQLSRLRYDHIMRLGWKVFIPLTLFWVVVVAVWVMSPLSMWK
jgi:NADH-quinone oxidoreductase subunit H